MLSRPSDVRVLRRFRAWATRREHFGSFSLTSVIFARTEAGRNASSRKPSILKSSALLYKCQGFLFVGHEVGTTVARDHNCATGISHPRRFVPVPSFEIAIQKTTGESISGTENVLNLDRKCRGLDFFAALQIHRSALAAALERQSLGS